MKYFKWINVRLILMFAIIVCLFSFTSKRNELRKLKHSEVIFVGENNLFVSNEVVNKLLIENKSNANTISKDKVDLNRLEKAINKQEMIEKSEVFVSIDGVLKAVVKQKTPIARVFDESDSFYIDYMGNRMPLSENYAAHVPIVSGVILEKNSAEITKLLRIIYNDSFLKKNIIGIQIMPLGNVKLTNRNFDYEIDFGQTVNIERKLSNYKAFFQKAVLDSSINKYKKINLKFTQQVICTK